MNRREQYYEKKEVNSVLARNDAIYKRALLYVLEGDPLTHLSRPINSVLGGFNPKSGIVEKFVGLTNYIHPHPDNRTILLDENTTPFYLLSDADRNLNKVIGQLQNLPIADSSVHLMVLDYTIEFMSNGTLTKFGEEANRVLTTDGLLLATLTPTIFAPLSKLIRSLSNATSIYPRSENEVFRRLPTLKPVLKAEHGEGISTEKGVIVAMAKHGSKYEKFTGTSIFFTELNLLLTGDNPYPFNK